VELIKTGILSAISVSVRLLALLGVNKVFAVYLGPNGYAAIGQLQNAMQVIMAISGGAINNGVIKYTAEYSKDKEKQYLVWKTAGIITLLSALTGGIIIFSFRHYLSAWLWKDIRYANILAWLALLLVLSSMNFLFLAILNGKREILRYVLANVFGSVLIFVVSFMLTSTFHLYGALLALTVYQAISLPFTLYLCGSFKWLSRACLLGKFDKKIAVNLGKYAAMALASAACFPFAHMFIRDHLGRNFGWDAAGHWEAMWRLSAAYLAVVTTTLSVYYLPRLSEIISKDRIRREIIYGYKVILPIALVFASLVYFYRIFIIEILLSSDFLPVEELFFWQLIGDVLKISGWMLSYLVVAKSMYREHIMAEIIFSTCFFFLVCYFSEFFGIKAAAIAHAVNYMLYFLFMFFTLKYKKII